jgi:hypothetical protein
MRYDGPATIRQDEQEVAAECVFTVRPPVTAGAVGTAGSRKVRAGLPPERRCWSYLNGESGRIVIDYLDAFSGASGTFMGPKRCPQPS